MSRSFSILNFSVNNRFSRGFPGRRRFLFFFLKIFQKKLEKNDFAKYYIIDRVLFLKQFCFVGGPESGNRRNNNLEEKR